MIHTRDKLRANSNSERQIGDDGKSLTDMDEVIPAELVTHNDTRCRRNVRYIREVFDQRTDLFKQVWDLRYQVLHSH